MRAFDFDLYCREGEEKERIQTRLGQRTSPDGHKKAGTEPHPRCRTYIVLDCVADRMGVGQMEREDFLPSTGCHN